MASCSFPFTMSKAEPPRIGITDFVLYVRKEIQKAKNEARQEAEEEAKQETKQEPRNDSKKVFFQLDTVELEIKFVTEKEGKAGIRLFVASLGGNYSREQTHTVKLSLSPYVPDASRTIGGLGGETYTTTAREKVMLEQLGSGRRDKGEP